MALLSSYRVDYILFNGTPLLRMNGKGIGVVGGRQNNKGADKQWVLECV